MTSLDKPPTSRDAEEHLATGPNPEPGDDLAALSSTAPAADNTRDYFRLYVQRVRGGEMGSLPAVTGLIVLSVFFSIVHPSFRTIFNFGNMLTEGTGTIFIAMGLVFVLLLGEIDLAAGYTAGVGAAVMVRLMVGYNLDWYHDPGRPDNRSDNRVDHGFAARQGRHPVVHRHAGLLPRLPGRHAFHPQHRPRPAR
jgi:hypothetical protein